MLLALLLLLPARVVADGASHAFEFVRLPVEPVGRSLAGAHLAAVEGPAALAWNPAGLAARCAGSLLLAHASWAAGTAWEWGAATWPIGDGALGLGCGYFRSGSLPGYDAEGRATGSFEPLEAYATLGYGRSFAAAWAVGVGLETLIERDGIEREYQAWAMNAGLRWDLGALRLAVAGLHMGPGLQSGEETYPLPMTVRGGVSWLLARTTTLHAAFDWVRDEEPRARFGFEWLAGAHLRALCGAQWAPQAEEAALEGTCGLAVDLGPTQVAYGFQPAAALAASHQVAITLRLGPAP